METITEKWELYSGRLNDGAECLCLKKNGVTFYVYAPGVKPFRHIWAKYSNGFPLEEFGSRELVIKNAEQIAGKSLEVIPFPHLSRPIDGP